MLQFEPGLLIWTAVSFVLLVLLLYRFGLPQLMGIIEKREKIIADSLAFAAENQKKTEQLIAENKKHLAEARKQADIVAGQVKAEAEKNSAEAIERATRHAAAIIEQTKRDMTREKEEILQAIRRETVVLVAEAAGKLLKKTVTVEDHRRLIEESIAEITNERN